LSQYYDDRMKNELDAIIKKIKNDMEAWHLKFHYYIMIKK
jgi:hypothetical protein